MVDWGIYAVFGFGVVGSFFWGYCMGKTDGEQKGYNMASWDNVFGKETADAMRNMGRPQRIPTPRAAQTSTRPDGGTQE